MGNRPPPCKPPAISISAAPPSKVKAKVAASPPLKPPPPKAKVQVAASPPLRPPPPSPKAKVAAAPPPKPIKGAPPPRTPPPSPKAKPSPAPAPSPSAMSTASLPGPVATAGVTACAASLAQELNSAASQRCLSNAPGAVNYISSADSRYYLTLQPTSGDLLFYDATSSSTMWSVRGTNAAGTSRLCVTETGNLLLTAPNGKTLWSSGTSRPNNSSGPFHVNIVEGNLVVKDGGCRSVWIAPMSAFRRRRWAHPRHMHAAPPAAPASPC
jgi:hypothetical protein